MGHGRLRLWAGGDTEEGMVASEEPPEKGIDESVMMREGMRLEPFQMQILECKTPLLLGETAHVMAAPLKAGVVQSAGVYTLVRKLEVRQTPRYLKNGSGSTDFHRDKYKRYPTPAGRVATLKEEELILPDPESHQLEMPEFYQIEGLSMCMTQVMDHFQCKESKCFVCGMSDHFVRDCPHQETFHK